MSSDGASLELMRSSGTEFDPDVVDALCQVVFADDGTSLPRGTL